MTALVAAWIFALTLVMCFIQLSWEPILSIDWIDVRIVMVLAGVVTYFYMKHPGKKGGKRLWHFGTADKWNEDKGY